MTSNLGPVDTRQPELFGQRIVVIGGRAGIGWRRRAAPEPTGTAALTPAAEHCGQVTRDRNTKGRADVT